MRKLLILSVLSVFAFACTQEEEKEMIEDVAEAVSTSKLRHVVMFKFNDDASQEAIDEVVASFENLQNEISEIKGFEWGVNNSPEGLDNDFTHIFTLTFDDDEGRAVYLPHPAHKAFGEGLGPILDKVMVLDYTID